MNQHGEMEAALKKVEGFVVEEDSNKLTVVSEEVSTTLAQLGQVNMEDVGAHCLVR